MNDNTNPGSKPFPSFSQLLITLPSSDPEYISTKAFRSHTEQGHILDAGVLSQHLSVDIKRVSWLESFLAPYLRDLADARERISYQKCLLSPIRRVPVEILQSIFLACLPEGFVEADPEATPLLLCQICKYWRDVALAYPLLWASFKVRRSSEGTCSPALPLARLWLDRSNPTPLSICLPVDTDRGCDPGRSGDVASLIRLLYQHISRWKSVHMCLRDLLYYEHPLRTEYVPSTGFSTVLDNLELCFPPDSVDPQPSDLGFRSLGDIVPMIWTSSPRLHTLTLNATAAPNILQILKTCPNIRDCELHVNDDNVFVTSEEKLTLPHLNTLNIRGRISILNILNAITTPSLRIFTIKGEKRWSQASFQDFIDRSSCSIEEFSMVNVAISAEYLLRTLEYIGTAVKVLRLHFYNVVRPISDVILRGIGSYLLVPNLEVLDMGCDSMDPENHRLFVEMVTTRLGWESSLQSGAGTEPLHLSPSSALHLGAKHTLRKICFSADRETAHMHTQTLDWIELIGKQGVDVKDEPAWRDYRIDGWFSGIRIWPGSHWWYVDAESSGSVSPI